MPGHRLLSAIWRIQRKKPADGAATSGVLYWHGVQLYRNLLYTAITRAKKKVILVGQKSTLFLAVHKADISKRNTKLAERIQMYCQVLAADHTARLLEAV